MVTDLEDAVYGFDAGLCRWGRSSVGVVTSPREGRNC